MKSLIKFFDMLPWTALVMLALLLGLAPFQPEPHLFEKVRMLRQGQLTVPLDMFDLVLHGTPLLLLCGKVVVARILARRSAQAPPTARGKDDPR